MMMVVVEMEGVGKVQGLGGRIEGPDLELDMRHNLSLNCFYS